MQLADYLDKGAALGPDAPCLTMGDRVMSYAEVQSLTHRVARSLARDGIAPGSHVAVLSENDPVAFACVFAISRAGGVWCPVNPRNEASENAYVLDAFDCNALIFHSRFAALVAEMRPSLPKLKLLVYLDAALDFAPSLGDWLDTDASPFTAPPADLAMLVGTGGTTGQPKGVMLPASSLEAMSAAVLMRYPFEGRPTYLAMAPLTHAAGVMAFPCLALGGHIVVMPKADLGEYLALIGRHRVTHSFLPPTLIYMLLDKPELATADLSSLQCLWYGAAPISPARLEEACAKLGPMAQIFGQTEAPMMISTMAPRDHYNADGSIARERLTSAGRPSPLVQVRIVDEAGAPCSAGERGEIVVRGSLVMAGYYKNPAATAEATTHDGWHRTGDIGFLDADDYLFIVDRAKDMIISGGFNVYSTEVEAALMHHAAVQDAAVFGLPDPKWGERVCAVVQLRAGAEATTEDILAATKLRIGSVKTPKSLAIWADLPRSKVGKVLKREIRKTMLEDEPAA